MPDRLLADIIGFALVLGVIGFILYCILYALGVVR